VICSLRWGEMAAVAPFRYAGIVWAILLGFLLCGRSLPTPCRLAASQFSCRPGSTPSTESSNYGDAPQRSSPSGFGLLPFPQPMAIDTGFSIAGEGFACSHAM
jgi:hypothetical protein